MAYVHHLDRDLVHIIFCFVLSTKYTRYLARSRIYSLKNYRRRTLDLIWESGPVITGPEVSASPTLLRWCAFHFLLSQRSVWRRHPYPSLTPCSMKSKSFSGLNSPSLISAAELLLQPRPHFPPSPHFFSPGTIGGWQMNEHKRQCFCQSCLSHLPAIFFSVSWPCGGFSCRVGKR